MPPKLTARQQALAEAKAIKAAEEQAKQEAEAQRKAEAAAKRADAAAKRAAKKAEQEAENDADDEEDEGQGPATPKGKGKGKAAATKKTPATGKKGKAAATPAKGKKGAAAAKKGKNAADDGVDEDGDDDDDDDDDDDGDQPAATPTKGKGKGKAAATPQKRASPKKAAPKKNAAAQKAGPARGKKRNAAEMEQDDDEDEANNNNDDPEEDEDNEGQQQRPAKRARIDPGPGSDPGPQANPQPPHFGNNAIAKSAQPNPRKRLEGSAFEIARKSASPPRPRNRDPPSGERDPNLPSSQTSSIVRARREQSEIRRMGEEAQARWRQRQKRRGQYVSEVEVRNGIEEPARRQVDFNNNDEQQQDNVGGGGEDEERREQERQEEERQEEERQEDERQEEERQEEERQGQERRERFNALGEDLAGAVARALRQLGRPGFRRGIEALAVPGALQVLEGLGILRAPAPGGAAPGGADPGAAVPGAAGGEEGAAAAGGGSDPNPDPDSSDDSSVSSDDSDVSENFYQQRPNIQNQGGLVRLRTRLTQLRANYNDRLQHARDHNLRYTQGIFTRAMAHPYGDPTAPEDLKRDFAHLKYLVQKLVSMIPLDAAKMADLTVDSDQIRGEFEQLATFWRKYWMPERPVFARWLLEALIWRRLHRFFFNRQESEYFAFGHGREMLAELWVTSLTACVGDEFPESVSELCELRARLATFLKAIYEQESQTRVVRAFEHVFCRGVLDFLRENVDADGLEEGRYLNEERAERELEMQDLAVQIIDHANDFNSRMLRSSGNWALIYRDPRDHYDDLRSDHFEADKMHARNLGDEYVVRENPTGDLGDIQYDDEGGQVVLFITPGLWDFTEWARIEINFVVPHVRPEVSLRRQYIALEKEEKGQKSKKKKKGKARAA
ncbi:hypothetical protein B0T20DRAFT_203753 [Sordaria brevicollis]|uniref:Uncharacterized protein n=1 Tax=Sordaria brevicollis TaxID=83679 RepID=A0AAE0PE36_SORBR|nr:hypothetical protein B0T20DRAFT_203753 [Sordaria brevicollis]